MDIPCRLRKSQKIIREDSREPKALYEYWAPETFPLGQEGDKHFAYSFAAQAVEVEVDLAYYLHQAGFEVSVVNPKVTKNYARAQMQRNKTAAVILGELPDVNRFNTAKQVTAFAGLTPEQLQSGRTLRQRGFTKMGSKHLRTALFMPALYAKQKNPLLAPYAQRLEAAGKGKMTIVGAIMRKLLHLIYGILKSQKPFDPNYLVNVQNTD